MKASRFSDAQKAFILKQGSDGGIPPLRTVLFDEGERCRS